MHSPADSKELLSHWLAFLRAPGLSAGRRRLIFDTLGSIQSVMSMTEPQARAFKLSTASLQAIRKPDLDVIARDLEWMQANACSFISLADPGYPALLARAADAPAALFVRGDLARLSMPCIALVGSRGATQGGLDFAKSLATAFSAAGLTVVSGLALGIDTAAHIGALVGPGSTAAVMATGMDILYPKQNQALADRILSEGGVVLTEMPPGTAPLPALFPQRNRIISGLSLGVVVVEASLQSGSLVTARFAGEQGREVFAVPGSIHNPMARGCHQLIRQGAKLIESAEDVLTELEPHLSDASKTLSASFAQTERSQARFGAPARRPAKLSTHAASTRAPLSAESAEFLELMGFDPISMDRLVDLSGASIAVISSKLLELEMDDHVEKLAGARYQRRAPG
jgi:DNA processing protein